MSINEDQLKATIAQDLEDKTPGAELEDLKNTDTNKLYITDKAARAYASMFKTSLHSAIEHIRGDVADIIKNGHQRVEEDGTRILWYDGIRIAVNSDQTRVFSYHTNHNRRSDVKQPTTEKTHTRASRLERAGLTPRQLSQNLTDDKIDKLDQRATLLRHHLGDKPTQEDWDDLRAEIADSISEALDQLDTHLDANPLEGNDTKAYKLDGCYELDTAGKHQLEANDWLITLTPDGGKILAIRDLT